MESRIKLSAEDIKKLLNQLTESALDIIEENVADSSASRGLSRRDSMVGDIFQGEQNYRLFAVGFEKLINQHFNSMEQPPEDFQQLIQAEELGSGSGRQTKRLKYEHHEDAEIPKYSAEYMALLKLPYDCLRIIIEKSRTMANVGDSAYLRLAKSMGQLNPEPLSANVSLVRNVIFLNLVIIDDERHFSNLTPNIVDDIDSVRIKYKDRPVQAVVIRIGRVGDRGDDFEFPASFKPLWRSFYCLISQFGATLKTFMLLRGHAFWKLDATLEDYILPAIGQCKKLERLYLPSIRMNVHEVLERVRVLSVGPQVLDDLPILENVQNFYFNSKDNESPEMEKVLGRMPNLEIYSDYLGSDPIYADISYPQYAEIKENPVNGLLQNAELDLDRDDYENIKTSLPRLRECDIYKRSHDIAELTEQLKRFSTQTSYIVRGINFRFEHDVSFDEHDEFEQLFALLSTLLRTRGTKRSTIALTFERDIVISPKKFFNQLLPPLVSLAKQVPGLKEFYFFIEYSEEVCECFTTLKLPNIDTVYGAYCGTKKNCHLSG